MSSIAKRVITRLALGASVPLIDGYSCVAVNPITLNRPLPLPGLPMAERGTVHVIVFEPILPGMSVVFGYAKYFTWVVSMPSVVPV